MQSWANKTQILCNLWPIDKLILHQNFCTIYQSKACSKRVKMSQSSGKTAQGKGKRICSKVSSTASKFQKNRANWKIHPGQYTTNFETNNMAIESSNLVDCPVKTVSKISLWVSTSFENKQAEIPVLSSECPANRADLKN